MCQVGIIFGQFRVHGPVAYVLAGKRRSAMAELPRGHGRATRAPSFTTPFPTIEEEISKSDLTDLNPFQSITNSDSVSISTEGEASLAQTSEPIVTKRRRSVHVGTSDRPIVLTDDLELTPRKALISATLYTSAADREARLAQLLSSVPSTPSALPPLPTRPSPADTQRYISQGSDSSPRSNDNVRVNMSGQSSNSGPSNFMESSGLSGPPPSSPNTRQAPQSPSSMQNGINGTSGIANGMNGLPTPAGHQSDLNFLYQLVEGLSSQLQEQRKLTSHIIEAAGLLRNRALNSDLTNQEVIDALSPQINGMNSLHHLTHQANVFLQSPAKTLSPRMQSSAHK